MMNFVHCLKNDIHSLMCCTLGADLVRFKAEVHFDGMELTRLHMKTMNLEKSLEVCTLYM